MVAMRDPVDGGQGGGAGAGGWGGQGEQGEIRRGRENSTGGRIRSQEGSSNFRQVAENATDAPDAAPPPGGPIAPASPFVPTPVQGNFFNLRDPRSMMGGRGGRSPFMPTNDLVRLLEQMRMRKLNDLYYQPYLSAFGRRF